MRHILLTTVALLIALPAFAGQERAPMPAPTTAPSTSSATTSAGAVAGSASRSRSSATGGRATATGGNVTVNGVTGSGGGYSARGNTPDLLLPGVSGGHPCGLGGGAGGSGAGFGAALGLMWPGRGCEVREKARLLHNLGYGQAAREAACLDDDLRRAMFSGGTPCARDSKGWER